MLSQLPVVHGSSCATTAEVSRYNRECMEHKVKSAHSLAFSKISLPLPARGHQWVGRMRKGTIPVAVRCVSGEILGTAHGLFLLSCKAGYSIGHW